MRLRPPDAAGKPGNTPPASSLKQGRNLPAEGGKVPAAMPETRSGEKPPPGPAPRAEPGGSPQAGTAQPGPLRAEIGAGTGEKAGGLFFSPNPPQTTPQEGLKQLALSLGLPQDTLSTALLAFGRYFSLPLEPDLLLQLRRNVLSLMENRALKFSSSKTLRDAAVLASVAAADKGLGLSLETLENYAEAIDPGGAQAEGREPPGDRGEDHKQRQRPQADDAPEPEDIRQKAAEIEANRPFLGILNKIPGKNGQRWIILPFVFAFEGVEFRVSMRILLKENTISENNVERLAVDVSSESRRWLFTIDKPGTPEARVDISVYPPPKGDPLAALEGEIREIVKDFAGEIRLRNHREAPPFGADSRNEVLLSVNEEV